MDEGLLALPQTRDGVGEPLLALEASFLHLRLGCGGILFGLRGRTRLGVLIALKGLLSQELLLHDLSLEKG